MRRAKARVRSKFIKEARENYKRETKYFTREEIFETLSNSNHINYLHHLLERKLRLKAQRIDKKYQYNDGSIYKGQWLGGFRDGKGRMEWKDGATYEG